MDQQTIVQQTIVQQYIEQLTPMEKIVFKIAQEHLETSFSLEKSIGFKEWLKNNDKGKELAKGK